MLLKLLIVFKLEVWEEREFVIVLFVFLINKSGNIVMFYIDWLFRMLLIVFDGFGFLWSCWFFGLVVVGLVCWMFDLVMIVVMVWYIVWVFVSGCLFE